MNGFLAELGKKVAERWLSLLLLPGLLWVATVVLCSGLRGVRPADVRSEQELITVWAAQPRSTGAVVVLLAGLLLASSAAGLASNWLAALFRRLWTTPGRRRPVRWLTSWRRRRWQGRDEHALELARAAGRQSGAVDSDGSSTVHAGPGYSEACARRDAISIGRPERPTWIGDRWQSTIARVHRAHGLDLTVVWPRLWTVLPDHLRADIAQAQNAYTATSVLTAWAVLYLVPTIQWWPAAIIVVVVGLTGVIRARAATDTVCVLVETAADLYTDALADQLTRPQPARGMEINAQLRE